MASGNQEHRGGGPGKTQSLYKAEEGDVTAEEKSLLVALAWMCQQYLADPEGNSLDHMCMGTGEDAVEHLFKYGLVDSIGRGARWTTAGHDLLNSS